jgi:hypothetical protein
MQAADPRGAAAQAPRRYLPRLRAEPAGPPAVYRTFTSVPPAPMKFQYSLSAFLRFLLALSLYFSLNFVLYVNSRGPQGEFAGWPFRFYLNWPGIAHVYYVSILWLSLDVAIGIAVACLLASLRWEQLKHFWVTLRTWGTPLAQPSHPQEPAAGPEYKEDSSPQAGDAMR